MSKKRNQYSFDFIEVIAFLYKWRKHLLIVVVSSAIIAGIVSSPIFITPQYKSTALFYPGTTNSISSNLFYTIKEKAKDPLKFGDEEIDAEYLQILESNELRSRVMDHFNLMNHYKIDTARKDKYTALYMQYEKNIKVRKTNYSSIEIAVFDEKPQMAADIANYMLMMIDTVKNGIQGRMAKQIFSIIDEQYKNKLAYIDSLKSRMKTLGVKGVYIGIKGVYNTPQIHTGADNISSKSNLTENGAEYFALEEELNLEVEQLTNLKIKYDQAKVDLDAKMSYIFVVGYASPSEGKAYPIRTLIVIVSMFVAFISACVVILLLEKIAEFKRTNLSNR